MTANIHIASREQQKPLLHFRSIGLPERKAVKISSAINMTDRREYESSRRD